MLNQKKRFLGIIILCVILIALFIWLIPKLFPKQSILGLSEVYKPTIVFVGDSMTEYLGNFDELRVDLKKYYPSKDFLLLNYGYSSTNILSVSERLEKDSTHSGRIFQAINNISFDIIILESMGHNPLSAFPMDQGTKMQNDALDKIVATIAGSHPKAKIIFMATIAPNKRRYGEGIVNLTTEARAKWAEERMSYIQNHINYANSHNIPLIDVYDLSLDASGSGNIDYINTNDFIHPSPTGIYFISEQIAKFLYTNKYF